MGDRGSIYIKDTDSGVYLYTHWAGTELPVTVQKALARQERWDDGQYLARILFDALTEGETGGESGYGISSVMGDNNHKVIVVNVDTQCVGFIREGQETSHEGEISFTDYNQTSAEELLGEFES